MTAPNTPTPELEPAAWAFDRPETPYQFWTTNPEADNLKREKLIPLVRRDEAAATIARLTAERDRAEATCEEQLQELAALERERNTERERAEAAEKRVKELEDHIAVTQQETHNQYLDLSEANKLLSERVAVLEAALEPFARYATDPFDKDHKGYPFPDGQGVGWVYLTHADFRRALAAREAK